MAETPFRFQLCSLIFRIQSLVIAKRNFETNSRFSHAASSMCVYLARFSLFFYFFSFAISESRAYLNFSWHRVRRRKTEETRQTVTQRAATNVFSFFGSLVRIQKMGSHCYYFITVLVLVINVVNIISMFGRFACRPTTDQIVMGIAILNQCCVIRNIAILLITLIKRISLLFIYFFILT